MPGEQFVIVREYVKCGECDAAHVLRIGIGGEPVQAHHFACTACGQEMGIRLERGVGWSYGPNAAKSEVNDEAPIINLHPSFVFAKDEIGSADAFPSLGFGEDMIKAILKARGKAGLPTDLKSLVNDQPPRPRVTEEWDHLRPAWSLHRNDKDDLVDKRRAAFIPTAGYVDPPETLADWVFQFAAELTQPRFEEQFGELFEQVKIAKDKADFGRFVQHYGGQMSSAHGRRHFETCKAYLGAFSELSQVHQLVTAGVEIGEDHAAASANFDVTKMLYGNLFESFGDNVETLVCLNNLIEDRPFDQLQNITLAAYQQTDKAGRCRAIAGNAAMSAICGEFDNQVRNASHHGGMVFDRETWIIEYRSGKGGQGEARTIGYASYLARCSTLFAQIMLLMRLEIFLANEFNARLPL